MGNCQNAPLSSSVKALPRIGIIGGMGPFADAHFLTLLCECFAGASIADTASEGAAAPSETSGRLRGSACGASVGAFQPNVILDGSCPRPDRTESILRGSTTALTASLLASVRRLEGAGAELLVMPCNTAHYLHPYLKKRTSLRFPDMVALTAEHCRNAGARTVGVLATRGCIEAGLYPRALEHLGLRSKTPSSALANGVHNAIYLAKRGVFRPEAVLAAANELYEWGCDTVILGCTELSLLLSRPDTASHGNFCGFPYRSAVSDRNAASTHGAMGTERAAKEEPLFIDSLAVLAAHCAELSGLIPGALPFTGYTAHP